MEADIKFEKALEQLEKIVEALESGNLTLDEALKKYEEGVRLSRLCTQKLKHAENKIEVLTKTLNSEFQGESGEGGDDSKPLKKKNRKAADPSPEADIFS